MFDYIRNMTYFAAYRNINAASGIVLRYQNNLPFLQSSSWSFVDVRNALGGSSNLTCGYSGMCFSGQYVFLAPFFDSNGYHGRVVRIDLTLAFNTAAVSGFDASSISGLTTTGFTDCIVVNSQFVHFVPFRTASGNSGKILRYDLTLPFTSTSSYSAFDTAALLGLPTYGFTSGILVNGHIYLSPSVNSLILKYNATANLASTTSYETFNITQFSGVSVNYAGAVFNNGYIIFVARVGPFLLYDTSGSFTNPSSWSFFNASMIGGISTYGHYRGQAVGKILLIIVGKLDNFFFSFFKQRWLFCF